MAVTCHMPLLTAFVQHGPHLPQPVPHQEAPPVICWGDRNCSVSCVLGWQNIDDSMFRDANPPSLPSTSCRMTRKRSSCAALTVLRPSTCCWPVFLVAARIGKTGMSQADARERKVDKRRRPRPRSADQLLLQAASPAPANAELRGRHVAGLLTQ